MDRDLHLSKLQSDASQRGKKGSKGVLSFLSLSHPLKNHSELAFLYDNFPIVFIKKDVVPNFNIENISRSFDNLNTSSTCNFSTSEKFRKIHHINGIMEILKYLINDIHYIDDLMEFININGGERYEKYEREQNN